ncbi:unnamed protein product [Allacma fusca]|uniref:Uncharacterized protein n=1 Tax=Allacma fusca TaxID=39272 RepID=A0A8J2KQ00_9HEXA|nr:unnamed protein product [Allacma fusca]
MIQNPTKRYLGICDSSKNSQNNLTPKPKIPLPLQKGGIFPTKHRREKSRQDIEIQLTLPGKIGPNQK